MAILIQELFLIAADLMFALVLSCLFYAVGCLVVPGLIGYVVFLSFGAGAMKNAKRNISQMKGAAWSMVSNSCIGQTMGKILGLAGFRGTEAPLLKEECSARLSMKQLPAGEKKCQRAVKTLTGRQLSRRTGTACGVEMQPGTIWEEKRETSQTAFLLSLLFAPLTWCLKKRPFQWLAAPLTTLKISRD